MGQLVRFHTPQLQKLHSGKVRDSYRAPGGRRLLAVTDRLSAFDRVLDTPILDKGRVLNRLAAFWFERTRDIVPNHFRERVGEHLSLVDECVPLKIEVIVRGAVAGSMWRAYSSGRRELSGVALPEGLTENALLETPIVTPTTKEDSDREITAAELVAQGLASAEIWEQCRSAALRLFDRGRTILAEKGLLLADTKYEFGLLDGRLMLIDEIHTPDSSRFWDEAAYRANPAKVEPLDKELVRKHLLAEKSRLGHYPTALPPAVALETAARYREIHRRITGEDLPPMHDGEEETYNALVAADFIKPGFVVIVMGSAGDHEHCQTLAKAVRARGVFAEMRVASAHKNGEVLPGLIAEYDPALEPGAIIAVAGLSNGLGGALAANTTLPVINCPPFQDRTDVSTNVASSLMMPSNVPAATVLRPDNAVQAALRSLNVRSVKNLLRSAIAQQKDDLLKADREWRQK